MTDPKISVIIPTYNRAELVGEAVQSVLNQTFTDFELLVVDNGSTDNTEAVIRSFDDPRLKYLKQPNAGAPAARNMGIRAARGQYVALLDDDDLFLPNKLALQAAGTETGPGAGMVYGQYYVTDGTAASRQLRDGGCHPPITLERMLVGTWIHLSTILVKKSWLEAVGGFDEQLQAGQDWDLYLRLALGGCKMVCVSHPLTVVRQQRVSISKNLHHRQQSLLRVLDKAFGHPNMPADLQPLRNRAYATRMIMTAGSAFLAAQPDTGRQFLERGLAADPTLTGPDLEALVRLIAHRIAGLGLDQPEAMLRRVTPHLPGDRPFVRRLKRRVWNRFYLQAAFKAYRAGRRWQCVRYVLKAVAHSPANLGNRGLVSIFTRSLLGGRRVTAQPPAEDVLQNA